MFTTFSDAIRHGLDYLGASPAQPVVRDVRRAVLESYRDLANAHNWSYLYHHGRIITVVPYGTSTDNSTIAYLHSSGTYPRQVTLSGGTWPAWAASGYLMVGTLRFRVERRVSATVLTLDAEVNPGTDVAAGTGFQLYQDTYLLPADYIAQDQSLYEMNFGGLQYVHPREWLYDNRYVFAQGISRLYTITGDNQYPGRLVIRVSPVPVSAASIDFIYKRRPRDLTLASLSTGTASIAASGTTVTASQSVFTPAHVGCVIRLGGSVTASAAPTGLVEENPALYESVISTCISGTQVTTQDAATATLSAVPYVVSDPIDIESGAMLNAFFRGVEKHLGMSRVLKDKPSAARQYIEALNEARAADSRSFTGRSEGDETRFRQRLRDMPVGPDQP